MADFQSIGRPQLGFTLNPRMIYYGLAGILVLWLLSGVYIVNPAEEAVVLRFGKAVSVAQPGVHYRLPFPIEQAEVEKTREVKRVEIGFRTIGVDPAPRYQRVPDESLMLTGDENIVAVELIVQYRILDIQRYLFRVSEIVHAVRSVPEAALRQVIGRHTIDEALTEGKLQIQQEIQQQVQKIFDLYESGLRVDQVKLQTVSVPQQVDNAFKDVASAREDRERLRNEAEAYQNDAIPRARGEVQKMLREADGYKVERVKQAQGDADRFLQVLKEYRNAKKVTEARLYLETMERILPTIKKYVVDGKNGGNVLNLLQLNPTEGEK